MFDDLIGNTHICYCLEQMIKKNAIGNSLLFAGPEGVGKSLFAERFAKKLVGSDSLAHPDIHHYRPEGKLGMHTILSMRELSEQVYLPPYASLKKVFIIHEAERMLSYSSNALLKTFEEPPLDTIIILLTSSPELLLPTIISRCRALHFQPLAVEEIASLLSDKQKIPPKEAMHIAQLSAGSASEAFRIAEKGEHPLRGMILDVLAMGNFFTYSELVAKAKQITDIIVVNSKDVEDSAKEQISKGYTEKLSAVQKEAFDKEIEGTIALYQNYEVQIFFGIIISWFRDLHLLRLKGNENLMFNPDRIEQAKMMAAQREPLSLEYVLESIKDVKTSFSRSTPLQICLETLFLKLNLL